MTNLCPNKDICGSCGWSDIAYAQQLEQKVAAINQSFQDHKLDFACNEILPSPKTNHYRNRMDFIIDFEGRVGLRQKGKWWRVIDNHTCFIADEKIEQLYHQVREWTQTAGLSFYDRKSHIGLLRYAVIRTTTTGESMIIIVTSQPTNASESDNAKKQFTELATISNPTTLVWSINKTQTDVSFGDQLLTITGAGYIIENISGIKYRITPNSFFQTNPAAAKIMLDVVTEFAVNFQPNRILDLYCGSGFFTIPLSRLTSHAVGVEIIKDAINDALYNNELNTTSAEFTHIPSEEFSWLATRPDLVLVDPPRIGLHSKVIDQIQINKPQSIIYVSCNPKNFTRDLDLLKGHYTLEKSIAIDMFPHTQHVELVSLLTLIS